VKIPGYSSRTTARGYRVVELDAIADPKRDQRWLKEARRTAASEADFQRETMRNWNISTGDSYYPEFATIGRAAYLYEPPDLLAQPVIRGWDFGWRMPGCVWMQYAPKSDRIFVLREFFPRGVSAHHFLEVCQFCSGQRGYEELDHTPREWVDMLRDLPGMVPPPWFPKGVGWVDLSGPEVNAVQSIAARDPREATLRGVWSNAGIEITVQAGPVKARADVLRRLLYLRPDGWPGIVISEQCPEVLAMLDGGLVYRRPTAVNPKPEDPRKDGRFDNIHDALTYALVGIVPADSPSVDPSGWEEGDLGWAESEGRDRW